MPRCPRCRTTFRTLEDEQDMHECPSCGLEPDASQCVSCKRWGPAGSLEPDHCCEECTEYQRCKECNDSVLTLSSDGLCDGCVEEAANQQPEEGDPD